VIHSIGLVVSRPYPSVFLLAPALVLAVVHEVSEREDLETLGNLKTWATTIPAPETTIAAQHMAVSFPSQSDFGPPAGLSERGRLLMLIDSSVDSLPDDTGQNCPRPPGGL
jgi:hypothetical protein